MISSWVYPLLQVFIQNSLLINQGVLLQQFIQQLLNLIILLLNITLMCWLCFTKLGLELIDLCTLVFNIVLQLGNLELVSINLPVNPSLIPLSLFSDPLPLAPLVFKLLLLPLELPYLFSQLLILHLRPACLAGLVLQVQPQLLCQRMVLSDLLLTLGSQTLKVKFSTHFNRVLGKEAKTHTFLLVGLQFCFQFFLLSVFLCHFDFL